MLGSNGHLRYDRAHGLGPVLVDVAENTALDPVVLVLGPAGPFLPGVRRAARFTSIPWGAARYHQAWHTDLDRLGRRKPLRLFWWSLCGRTPGWRHQA